MNMSASINYGHFCESLWSLPKQPFSVKKCSAAVLIGVFAMQKYGVLNVKKSIFHLNRVFRVKNTRKHTRYVCNVCFNRGPSPLEMFV